MKYQSSSTHCSKVISKVKVSERRTEWHNYRVTEWQNNRQDKNNMPPDLRSRGHKNKFQMVPVSDYMNSTYKSCCFLKWHEITFTEKKWRNYNNLTSVFIYSMLLDECIFLKGYCPIYSKWNKWPHKHKTVINLVFHKFSPHLSTPNWIYFTLT